MRKIRNNQLELGAIAIENIAFNARSRDEIPQLLKGLQYIYIKPEIRKKVFDILENIIPQNVNKKNGRPGLDLWKILVLGTIRLNCNWDYDKLQDIADNHIQM